MRTELENADGREHKIFIPLSLFRIFYQNNIIILNNNIDHLRRSPALLHTFDCNGCFLRSNFLRYAASVESDRSSQ